MRRRTPAPLAWLGALLALYLCAPLVAGVPKIVSSDWASVDWNALGSAVGVSAASATMAALVIAAGGIPLGYWLARRQSRFAAIVGFLVQLPLALPPLTSGILLLFLLGPYSVAGELTNGALTDSFLGILLAGVFVAAPFLIVAARSAFSSVDPILEDVAATLGHRAHARFFKVALPLAWPAIRAGLLLSWLRAFGEFGATVMVAYHPYSLPVYTYVAFGSQGLPVMMPIVLPTLAVALVAALFAGGSSRLGLPRSWRQLFTARDEGAVPSNRDIDAGDDDFSAAVDSLPSKSSRPASLHFSFRKRLGTFELDIEWAPRARRLAILGESGSGKSMTLRLLAGLESADAARFSLGGASYETRAVEARHIAYVPQDYGLFPHMTVAEQWAFAKDTLPGAAKAWARHLGLEGLEARLPAALSIGQRQRVSIVRALARPCRLILLDEPFASLDTPRRRQLRDSLRRLQAHIDATTILVTHDPDEAALLASEILVIDRGRILQQGSTQTVFGQPASLQVANLLGLSNVGDGYAGQHGTLDIGAGVTLPLSGGYAPGTHLMWRIDPEAIAIVDEQDDGQHRSTDSATDGAIRNEARTDLLRYTAEMDDVLLIDGRSWLTLRFGRARLRLRASSERIASPDERYGVANEETEEATEMTEAGNAVGDVANQAGKIDEAPRATRRYRLTIDPSGIAVWPHGLSR